MLLPLPPIIVLVSKVYISTIPKLVPTQTNPDNNDIHVLIYNLSNLIGYGSKRIFENYSILDSIIIDEKYRKNGFGKQIIEKLIDIGKNECKCYKIILNCLEKNIKFYENCGFINVGVEMKLL